MPDASAAPAENAGGAWRAQIDARFLQELFCASTSPVGSDTEMRRSSQTTAAQP
jgi:hypothetical protein